MTCLRVLDRERNKTGGGGGQEYFLFFLVFSGISFVFVKGDRYIDLFISNFLITVNLCNISADLRHYTYTCNVMSFVVLIFQKKTILFKSHKIY